MNFRVTRGTSVEDFMHFETLHDALKQKKQFRTAQGAVFFSNVQKDACPFEEFVVHIAWTEAGPIAGHVGSIVGDSSTYLLGAASDAGRDLRASFRLQWEFMRYARDRGALWYDLGGIDPTHNPDVYRFKARMNGAELSWPGSFDYSGHWLLAAAWDLLRG